MKKPKWAERKQGSGWIIAKKERDFIKSNAKNLTADLIAEGLGRSIHMVRRFAYTHGISLRGLLVKTQPCGELVKKRGMLEARPCLGYKNHRHGYHAPDLTGLNINGVEVLRRGPDYKWKNTRHRRWIVKDKLGFTRVIAYSALFQNQFDRAPRGSGLSTNGEGHSRPEFVTVRNHWNWKYHPKFRTKYYQRMRFYDAWNPRKGGSFVSATKWILENIGPKPDPFWQLHVLKTKKHPHGFFGPGGIVWRSKMDCHDRDLLDLIYEWPEQKLREFVRREIQPLLKAA